MIRPAELADANALCELNKYELGYEVSLSFTQHQLKKLLADQNKHFLLVYEGTSDDTVKGYLHAEVYDTLLLPPVFNIMSFAVSKDFQKQGIGKKLLHALETEARDRHFSGIRLNSNTIRTEAHQFYEHLGYESHKTQKCFTKKYNHINFIE